MSVTGTPEMHMLLMGMFTARHLVSNRYLQDRGTVSIHAGVMGTVLLELVQPFRLSSASSHHPLWPLGPFSVLGYPLWIPVPGMVGITPTPSSLQETLRIPGHS